MVLVELLYGGFECQFAARDLESLDEVGGARVKDAEAVFVCSTKARRDTSANT